MTQLELQNDFHISGRSFSKKELQEVCDTVKTFKNLSRKELVHTICENLGWFTPAGKLKSNSCSKVLDKLEQMGIITLPQKRSYKSNSQEKLAPSKRTDPGPDISCDLKELGDIQCMLVSTKEQRQLWNEYVDRYHYRGYKKPFGAYARYFVTAKGMNDQIVGCLLFSSSSWAIEARDKWIGWKKKDREQRLNLVLNNSRFLIFPWVKVRNLASKILSIIPDQLTQDWQKIYNYKPVLLETYVDAHFEGTCYKAANWSYLGKTKGRGRMDALNEQKETIKKIYVFPIQKHSSLILRNKRIPKNKSKKISKASLPPIQIPAHIDDEFTNLWRNVVGLASDLAFEYDQKWRVRRRTIDTMLLILLIFRLVFSSRTKGYRTTIEELWEQCKLTGVNLPQESPIAASSFSQARSKLDENVFRALNKRVFDFYDDGSDEYQWLGHRVFAVDGSKVNLPPSLSINGYKLHCNKYYPQGLVSCLYQLKSQIPYDFDLVAHNNERMCAVKHLDVLGSNDLVVYDRGYFAYSLLYYHAKRSIDAVFRLQSNAFKELDDFIESEDTERVITLCPVDRKRQWEIKQDYPDVEFVPIELRLIKYQIKGQDYYLGTTLMDKELYHIVDLCDLYHSRWGIEELYKISKTFIDFEDFHSKSQRGVKQEVFAHFCLITFARFFTNQANKLMSKNDQLKDGQTNTGSNYKVNFKNALSAFVRKLEPLLFAQASAIKQAASQLMGKILKNRYCIRANRFFARISRKPNGRFDNQRKKKKLDLLPAH